jgi:hypothetical protein
MIRLSEIDRMNEQLNSITTTQVPSKIDELRNAIARIYSDNYSSTNRSRLVSVSKCGNYCFTEEVASEYSKIAPKPGLSKQPSYLVWNGLFF